MSRVFIIPDPDTPNAYTDMNHWSELHPVIEEDGNCWFVDMLGRRWEGEPGPLRTVGPMGVEHHTGYWCWLSSDRYGGGE